MNTFTTTGPSALTIRFAAGDLHVVAEDRDSTTVEVLPKNPASDADVEHANATTVEQRGDEILVIAPNTKRWFGRGPRLQITVAAPVSSRATVFVESAQVAMRGRLGDVDVNSASGDVRLERAAALTVSSASGDVWVDDVDDDARVKTASGDVRVSTVGGSAELTTASGDIHVQHVGGDVLIRTASGDAFGGDIGGSVSAKTASGDIAVTSVTSGSVEIDSASGDVSLGIAAGSAAWLEVQSLSGNVTSDLQASDAPADGTATVTVRARSLSGDISIRRAPAR